MILIITIKDDIHAITIQNELKEKGYPECYIVECDRLSASHGIFCRNGIDNNEATIMLADGRNIDIAMADLIWWRRVRADQQLPETITDEHQVKLINNDCRGALAGILEANFTGKWISSPAATDKASNKIYQLAVAKKCGFRIPETLISQSQDEVQEFILQQKGKVIVKPVVGAAGPLMFTAFIDDAKSVDAESFQICPAVYQEFITGTRHIRLNCFGNKSYAAIIETEDLDWRPNLNVPIYQWDVPEMLHKKIRKVLDALELEMGVLDFKITPEGEFVWLEVNPQGQFLFLEPLTKMPLASIFADYLLSCLPVSAAELR
jgi:glutathione synthase/RimK-type ligase-like ATP-grasp enzyme